MTTPITDNLGKVLARRPKGPKAILALTYAGHEAEALRRMAGGIRIKGDRKPSMSLIARLSLYLFEDAYARDPEAVKARLERMATAVPHPATYSKKAKKEAAQ